MSNKVKWKVSPGTPWWWRYTKIGRRNLRTARTLDVDEILESIMEIERGEFTTITSVEELEAPFGNDGPVSE